MKYAAKFSSMKNKIKNETIKKINFLAEDLITKSLRGKFGLEKVNKKFAGSGVFEKVERENDSTELLNNKITALLFMAIQENYDFGSKLVFDEETYLPNNETAEIIKNPQLQKSRIFQEYFAVAYENAITPTAQTLAIGFYDQLVQVKNIGWGDSYAVTVNSNEVLRVGEVGQDTLKLFNQKLHNNEYTATPRPYGTAVSINFYDMASGKMDWAEHITGVAKAFVVYWNLMNNVCMTTIVDDAIANNGGLDTPYFKATLSEANHIALVKLLKAANNSNKVNVYGDLSAVNQLIPNANANVTYMSLLGDEFTSKGYISTFLGANIFETGQIILPGTINDNPLFGAPEKYLWYFSEDEQPLHLVFEGNTLSVDRDHFQTGDGMLKFAVVSNFDMIYVPASKIGAIVIN